MKYIEDTLTGKICNILCKLNVLCRVAIALGFDGLCLSLNIPCPIYILYDRFSEKFVKTRY